jgi:hypothetical protein
MDPSAFKPSWLCSGWYLDRISRWIVLSEDQHPERPVPDRSCMAIGPGLGLVETRTVYIPSLPTSATLALLVILFDGGLNLPLQKVMNEAPMSLLFTVTVFGLIMTATAVFYTWLLGRATGYMGCYWARSWEARPCDRDAGGGSTRIGHGMDEGALEP